MCHLILLLPLVSLPLFWLLPLDVAVPLYGVIVAVSLWVYVYVMRAMHRPVGTGAEEILHSTGKVIDVNGNTLRVRVHSETWNAVSADVLDIGEAVRIVGMNGLTLRVRRLQPKSGPEGRVRASA
jgi:membrane protein implicated in regulation of membrane protease activity